MHQRRGSSGAAAVAQKQGAAGATKVVTTVKLVVTVVKLVITAVKLVITAVKPDSSEHDTSSVSADLRRCRQPVLCWRLPPGRPGLPDDVPRAPRLDAALPGLPEADPSRRRR